MKWNKYTIKTTTEAEDLVSGMLLELGIEGIEIEDNVPLSEEDKKTMFIDILPVLPPDEGVGYVSFYLDDGEDNEGMLVKVRAELDELRSFAEIGEGSITESQTEDKDWINNWKEFFKTFEVDDIVIRPSWEKTDESHQGKIVIQIDPGTAFGTGMHETTQLCIRQLKKYVNSDTRLLDVGCGSGILSIIGLKLGAAEALGTDIDPNAITATHENIEVNHVPVDRFRVLTGNVIEDTALQEEVGLEKYDVVVANILADIIIPLSGVVSRFLKKGGIYITSGIINTKEEAVVKAIKENGLEILEITRQGEWVSVTARKN